MTTWTPEKIRERRIDSYLVLADRDMISAKAVLSGVPEHTAYFLQQATEKLLRAVLEVERIPAGTSHNIRGLADLLQKTHELYDSFIAFDGLSAASTRYRYPSERGDLASVSASEMAIAIPKLEALQAKVTFFVRARLN